MIAVPDAAVGGGHALAARAHRAAGSVGSTGTNLWGAVLLVRGDAPTPASRAAWSR